MYYWSREIDTIEISMRELDIGSTRTVVDWRHFCRDVCAEYYIRYPLQTEDTFYRFIEKLFFYLFTGFGHVAEIDESCFGKHSYERDRLQRTQQWIFEGIDMQTKNVLWWKWINVIRGHYYQ